MEPSVGDGRFEVSPARFRYSDLKEAAGVAEAVGFQSGSKARWLGSSGSGILRGERSWGVQWTWGGKSGPVGPT